MDLSSFAILQINTSTSSVMIVCVCVCVLCVCVCVNPFLHSQYVHNSDLVGCPTLP